MPSESQQAIALAFTWGQKYSAAPTCFYDRARRAFERWEGDQYRELRTLTKAQCGSVALYEHMPSGNQFAVKVMPKFFARPNEGKDIQDERSPGYLYEDPLREVGVLAHLNDLGVEQVIPNPRRYCCDDDFDYILLKHCPEGDLFNSVVSFGGPLPEEILRQHMRNLLSAVQKLHAANIAHRDLSLENILIDEDGLRLIDFSQAVPIRGADGVGGAPGADLRYFVQPGKESYRAPEANLPHAEMLVVTAPADCKADSPALVPYGKYFVDVILPTEVEPQKVCMARLQGYRAAPIDAFACGACLFTMAFLRPDALRRKLTEHLHACNRQTRPGSPLSDSGMHFLESLLDPRPDTRLTVEDALRHPWLQAE